jgi:hypothetical protein
MAHDVDGFLFHFAKTKSTNTALSQKRHGRSGEIIVPWNIGNASVTTSTSRAGTILAVNRLQPRSSLVLGWLSRGRSAHADHIACRFGAPVFLVTRKSREL